MLQGFVSNEALDIMVGELQRSNGSQLDSSNCGCRLRSSCGLPCACMLSMYSNSGQCVPLDSIHIFWRTLDILQTKSEEDDDICCDVEIEKFKETFSRQSRPGKIGLLRKLKNMFDAGTTSVQEPVVQKNTRGRPKLKKKSFVVQKDTRGRSNPIGFDLNVEPERQSFSIDVNNEHNGQCSNNERRRHSSYMANDLFDQISMPYGYIFQQQQDKYYYQQPMIQGQCSNGFSYQDPFMQTTLQESMSSTYPFIDQIPSIFRPFVRKINDVIGDGNCGFRSVAVALGRHEDEYRSIRHELYEELMSGKYNEYYAHEFEMIRHSIAEDRTWMIMPDTSALIAERYKCIVNFISANESSTCFPLFMPPPQNPNYPEMTILQVNNNHFVHLEMEENHPMPTVNILWAHCRQRVAGWDALYRHRLNVYIQSIHVERDYVDLSTPSMQ